MINPKIFYWTFSSVLLATFIIAIISIAKSSKDGIDGNHGEHGKHGKHGIGIDGNHGNHGNDGNDGYDGYDGDNGHDGSHGYDGDNGDNGIKGINGDKGDKGQNGKHAAPNMHMTICPERFMPIDPLDDYVSDIPWTQKCMPKFPVAFMDKWDWIDDEHDLKNEISCSDYGGGNYTGIGSIPEYRYCELRNPISIVTYDKNDKEITVWLHRQDLVPPSVYPTT